MPAGTPNYPSSTFSSYKTNLLNAMLDAGINRIRLEMRYDDYNATGYTIDSPFPNAIQPSTATSGQKHYDRIDHAMDSWVTDYRAMLAAQGESLFITICFVDFRSGGYQAETVATEAALLIKEGVQHFYTTYGYLPDAIEPILEPDNQSGGGWTAARLADIIVQARTNLSALDSGGSPGYGSIKFVAPSTTDANVGPTWWSGMKSAQASIPSLILEFSYHSYSSISNGMRDAIWSAANSDGVKTSMLEVIGADYDANLYYDLTNGMVSGWQQFTATFPPYDTGGEYFQVNTSTWVVTPSARTKWLRHVFKYVRRNAVRKGASSDNGSFTALAFQNANGSVATIIRNTASGSVTVSGLPAGTYGINYSYGSSTSSAPSTYDSSFSNQTITGGQDVTFTMSGAGIASVYDITYLDQISTTASQMSGGVTLRGTVRLA